MYTLLEIRFDGWGYVVSTPAEKEVIEKLQKLTNPCKGYEFKVVPVSEARKNSKLVGREYLTR